MLPYYYKLFHKVANNILCDIIFLGTRDIVEGEIILKIVVYRVASILLLCVWLGVIFGLSAETAAESSGTSGGFIRVLAKTFISNFDKMSITEQGEIIEAFQGTIRTAAHLITYIVLGFLAANTLVTFKLTAVIRWISPIMFGTLYAVSDEIHQHFVPGRAFQISDIVVDIIGVVLGVLAFWLIVYIAHKIFKGEKHQNG